MIPALVHSVILRACARECARECARACCSHGSVQAPSSNKHFGTQPSIIDAGFSLSFSVYSNGAGTHRDTAAARANRPFIKAVNKTNEYNEMK